VCVYIKLSKSTQRVLLHLSLAPLALSSNCSARAANPFATAPNYPALSSSLMVARCSARRRSPKAQSIQMSQPLTSSLRARSFPHYFAPQYCLCQHKHTHCQELKTPATEDVATSPRRATLASLFLLLFGSTIKSCSCDDRASSILRNDKEITW
jgi:hypothetical protein